MTEDLALLKTALADHYTIERRVGAGGMATVYLAYQKDLDRNVAIKVLPQAFLRDNQFKDRFKREARIAAKLEHPNIINIHQINEEENLP